MSKTKRIKIFPAPHIEIRIHVTEQMIKDYRKCQEDIERDDFADCSKCSWKDVNIDTLGMCELKQLNSLIGKEVGEARYIAAGEDNENE